MKSFAHAQSWTITIKVPNICHSFENNETATFNYVIYRVSYRGILIYLLNDINQNFITNAIRISTGVTLHMYICIAPKAQLPCGVYMCLQYIQYNSACSLKMQKPIKHINKQ